MRAILMRGVGALSLPLMTRPGGSAPSAECASSRSASGKDAEEKPGLIATAASTESFRALINALVAADLLEALRSDGPFTVFAPGDEALAKLPADDLGDLGLLRGALVLLPEAKELHHWPASSPSLNSPNSH